jgi:uncharacterized protein (DUF58 family)
VKLTSRGGDFLKACLAATLIATILDTKVVLALCLAMTLAAVASEMVLSRSFSHDMIIQPENDHVLCFKGESITVGLTVVTPRRRLVSAWLSELVASEGVDSEVRPEQNNYNICLRPKFAGRFQGLSAKFELNDPLGLFRKTVEFSSESFLVDCYPSSMLKETKHTKPLSISLGEREGRGQGTGTEFYSVDEYRSLVERRNIFWKKVASQPDEKLLVKTRSSSIQETISISLILTSERPGHKLEWIDSACEGVALIGKTILDIGCDVSLLYDSNGQIVSRQSSNLRELSEAIMEMSTATLSDITNIAQLLGRADIVMTGFIELQNTLLAQAIAKKPSLLIEDGGEIPPKIGELAVVFHPFRDFDELVRKVTGT